MVSSLNPGSELFLADVDRIQQRLADANRQVSSGKRIAVASDAPDQLGQLMQLRASLQHNTQVQSNLSLAKTDADVADDTLSQAIKLMDRALTLATQGADSTMNITGRQNLAQEVQALQQEMTSFSQTTVQGRYIFSGDQNLNPPTYAPAPDPTQTGQVLTVPLATRKIEDPAGGAFPASLTAQDIFDHRNADFTVADDNVYNALSNLASALEGGDPAAVSATVPLIKAASAHINSMQSFYGLVQNRISDASSYATTYDTQLRTQISRLEDADVASAAIELSQGAIQLQATFQMQARMPQTSLFNYLG